MKLLAHEPCPDKRQPRGAHSDATSGNDDTKRHNEIPGGIR